MATMKRRLFVTLEPELDVVLRRLSKLQKRPQAAIIREILMGGLPQLVQLADLLEQAERLDPAAFLASMAATAHADIASVTQRALVLPPSKPEKRSAGKKRGTPPRSQKPKRRASG